jgi:hypothetical protein
LAVAALLVPQGAAGQAADLAVQADLEVVAAVVAVGAMVAHPLLAEVCCCLIVQLLASLSGSLLMCNGC